MGDCSTYNHRILGTEVQAHDRHLLRVELGANSWGLDVWAERLRLVFTVDGMIGKEEVVRGAVGRQYW